MQPLVLTGGSVVLRDRVVETDLHIEDGLVAGIGDDAPAHLDRIDCSDCHILPGFVDLHTDNVERHVEPRPGIFWAPERAVLAHDAELAAAGVTTAFDALTLGGGFADAARQEAMLRVVEALDRAREQSLLRVDHHLHLRCELSDAALPEIIAWLESAAPRIVSLMNHTPGQRQWRNLEKFRAHYTGRYGLSEAELSALIAARQNGEATVVPDNLRHAIALATRSGARLASHDDTDARDVDAAAAAGCLVSEFPTTTAAAAHAAARGLAVLAGAPNLVCGASHSGNVAVADLANNGTLHVLASDYRPSSLVEAVFLLHDRFGWPLSAAAQTVSWTPAQLLGLDDRGEIATGRRADVIVVSHTGLGPLVRETWSNGIRVF